MIDGKWDGDNYVLKIDWSIDADVSGYHINIVMLKAGFVTDGGSIPWWYEWRLNPVGKYLKAYIVHDIIYATEYLPRAVADAILRELIKELGGNRFIRNAVYMAVRIGGGSVWKQHTEESIRIARNAVHGFYEYDGVSFEFGNA